MVYIIYINGIYNIYSIYNNSVKYCLKIMAGRQRALRQSREGVVVGVETGYVRGYPKVL